MHDTFISGSELIFSHVFKFANNTALAKFAKIKISLNIRHIQCSHYLSPAFAYLCYVEPTVVALPQPVVVPVEHVVRGCEDSIQGNASQDEKVE